MCLGIPGQIVAVNPDLPGQGTVEIAGVRRVVNLSCVLKPGEAADECVGVWVLVHVGFAMARIDEQEAKRTLELIKDLGEAQDEIMAFKQSGVTS